MAISPNKTDLIQVKICGITNLEDALTAVDAGADYLGFIFYPPSPRAISAADAQTISAQLRARPNCPLLVGVFVNETAGQMAAILDQCQLDLAQLSGEEPPALMGEPESPIYGRAYKALRPTSLAEAEADAEWYVVGGWGSGSRDQGPDSIPQSPIPNPRSPSLLIDTHHPNLRGGTGKTGDWTMIARLVRSVPGVMLAGGLTAVNVTEAVRQVRPFAVDVASGVEAAPGRKDHELVRRFIAAARIRNNQ